MSQLVERRETTYGIWEETSPVAATLSPQGRGDAVAVEQSRLTWRPSPAIAADVPVDFCIEFDVCGGPDGVRRFVPVDGYGPFTQKAWLAGLAIYRHARTLSNEQVFSYRMMKLIFDRVRSGREHLDRKFASSRDLFVRPTGRGGGITASLLPDYVGLTSDGAGHSWSIRELTRHGRDAAVEAGYENPTNDRAIAYGLMQAAEMNPSPPLDRTAAQMRVLTALFDAGEDSTAVEDAVIDDVVERLCMAVEEHGDDVWERFEGWYAGRNNNLVQSLARKSGFPRLSRAVVKAALLRLGLRSYEYFGVCLSYFARVVRDDLSEPLTADERRTFVGMYLPQDCYGGLPLVLLRERWTLIGPVAARLWESPTDERLIGALHRLLQIYSDMASTRRAADRRFAALRTALQPTRDMERPESSAQETEVEERQEEHRRLRAAVRRLLLARREGCPDCANGAAWELEMELVGDGEAVVDVTCREHTFDGEYRYEFAEILTAIEGGDAPES
ncbi:MAG: hypothetical protein JNK76_14620 [Planctomycetales bacterium]|nr:hypothetical protein [Planctomycetales bacterium]